MAGDPGRSGQSGNGDRQYGDAEVETGAGGEVCQGESQRGFGELAAHEEQVGTVHDFSITGGSILASGLGVQSLWRRRNSDWAAVRTAVTRSRVDFWSQRAS